MIGKVSGAVLGFLLGVFFGNAGISLVLGTIGALVGHLLIDRDSIPPPRSEMPPTRDEVLGRVPRASATARPLPRPTEELARALCPIFIEVARADGEVSQAEIRVVKEFFEEHLQFVSDDLEAVRRALKDAIAAPPADLEALVKNVRGQVKPSERLMTVNALYELALVDGDLTRAESDALKRVVSTFNLSEEQLREITALQLGSGRLQYAALGLTEASTDDEIKGAFRRLAAEHHPDRFASKGPKESEAAAEKFRQIKDAYDDLKKLRGL
ncbi:MAG: DnaJ-like protein DjlA [Myxococcaceae bacterium]|nr:DnaJ-like protein DjlA [Myxococcaceae bacterium]